ncbi:dihydrofolate reductase [Medusavirus stheno T3]|uniref:dihydrofolate reductase n=1 Tax=Medusavirus stheno T3 TaxID=3069717 RepID=A0A7S7YF17_9VIRU|nr:dihydrofolate reductase [Acanthamoeba castellanii medusavirus]QPB44609.1 dihydrofolate reductase [Medusavirus stheno T3]
MSATTRFDIIVAYAERDRAIGRRGAIPWPRLRADMQHFAQATRGGTVIMGRLTYASLPHGRPLPGRRNIVVSTTTSPTDYPPGVAVAPSLDIALALAATCPNVWVIGGARLYADALAHPAARRLHATALTGLAVPDADAHFPAMPDDAGWAAVGDGVACDAEGWVRTVYERKGDAPPQQ